MAANGWHSSADDNEETELKRDLDRGSELFEWAYKNELSSSNEKSEKVDSGDEDSGEVLNSVRARPLLSFEQKLKLSLLFTYDGVYEAGETVKLFFFAISTVAKEFVQAYCWLLLRQLPLLFTRVLLGSMHWG